MYATSQTPRHSTHRQWAPLASPYAKGFTADEQIENYNQWKTAAINEMEALIERTRLKALTIVEDLIKSLQEVNIAVKDVYFKHTPLFKVAVLILVNEDVFLSDEFRKAYEITHQLVSPANNDILQLDISFASLTPDTDEGVIYCDGYTFKLTESNE